jgi:hypothetical protein
MVSSTSSSTQLTYNPVRNRNKALIEKITNRFAPIIKKNVGNDSERGINVQITKHLKQVPFIQKEEERMFSSGQFDLAMMLKGFSETVLYKLKLHDLILKPSILQKEKEKLKAEKDSLAAKQTKAIQAAMRAINEAKNADKANWPVFRDEMLKAATNLINTTKNIDEVKLSDFQKEAIKSAMQFINDMKDTDKALSAKHEYEIRLQHEADEKQGIALQQIQKEFHAKRKQYAERELEHNKRPQFITIEKHREFIQPYAELLAADATVSREEKERQLTEILTGMGLEMYQKYIVPYLNLLKTGTTVSPEEKKQKIQELLKKIGSIPLSDAAHYDAFKNAAIH